MSFSCLEKPGLKQINPQQKGKMNNYNPDDLYKDPRMTRPTSDMNDAMAKRKYRILERIEEELCRLSDHHEAKLKMNNLPTKTQTPEGLTEYRLNGELHREDGPAYDDGEGCKAWYLHGKKHREGAPAVENPDGSRCWFLNGELHREGGPAVETPNPYFGGDRKMVEYYVHGKLHREDGPALDDGDGQREWYLDGKRHCVTGPAVEEECTSYEGWWINGELVGGPEDVVDYWLAQNIYCIYNPETDSLEFE